LVLGLFGKEWWLIEMQNSFWFDLKNYVSCNKFFKCMV
jgi:hypothetical protein